MSALKQVQRFPIVLVLLWCFVCLHVQEWQGKTCPSNTTISVMEFVVLLFISNLARMVMAEGNDGRAGCCLHSIIHHAFRRV